MDLIELQREKKIEANRINCFSKQKTTQTRETFSCIYHVSNQYMDLLIMFAWANIVVCCGTAGFGTDG